MSTPASLALLILPLVLAGASNMVYVRLPVHAALRTPMDGGRRWRDGRRLLGDNKTWKGFLGMIGLTALWLGLFEVLAETIPAVGAAAPFPFEEWRFPWNGWLFGAWWGLGYVLFELPNSFVKRRLGIRAGRNAAGVKGRVFTFIDQADSVVGCTIFLLAFHDPGPGMVLGLLIAGTLVHYLTNIALYSVGLKEQAG